MCASYVRNFFNLFILGVFSLACLLVPSVGLIPRVIMHFLIVSTVRALAALVWPLSLFWRYLVHNNDSITDLVVN